MKPNDISDKAWAFALQRWYWNNYEATPPDAEHCALLAFNDNEDGFLAENVEYIERMARAFDKATADLRELPRLLTDLIAESGGVVGLHLNGDYAPWGSLMDEGEFGDWLGREFTDTLAAYTPMVAYRDLKGEA